MFSDLIYSLSVINGVLKLKSEVDLMRRNELALEKSLENKFLGVDLSGLDADALKASLVAGLMM